MRRRIRIRAVSVGVSVSLALGSLALAGCGSGSTATASGSTPEPGSSSLAVTGTITVLAAASLQEAFTTLGKQFEAAHPGTTVRLSFGASSALALQITEGAPADVFASASAANMKQVTDAQDATQAVPFASNVMEIAVPPDNPAAISNVDDLARAGIKIALCQPQVPCGSTARQVFAKAGITVAPVTLEADVKSTLAKVQTGEVDAGVVYVTDVRAAGTKVKGIEIPSRINASTSYPIATLSHASNAGGAQAFVDYVLSADGQAVLTADGFAKP